MKARPERRESEMLVERAQGLMRESKKLLEQREAQLRQMEHFVMRADEKLAAFLELESPIEKKSLGG
jgi:hypothetical protein